MKTIFNIGDSTAGGKTLLCEWGDNYCCYGIYDVDANKILNLHCAANGGMESAVIDELLNDMRRLNPENVVISSSFSHFTLIPFPFTENSKEVLQSLVPFPVNGLTFQDRVNEWQLLNCYCIPEMLLKKIKTVFPNTVFTHTFTSALRVYNGFDAPHQLSVNFSPNQFNVIVRKSGQLHLAQMYNYQAPLDVVYYLLKIVHELELPKDDTLILLSGLVEQDSDLYRELHQYFLNIHLVGSAATVIESDYPAHYFTSISNLAACVS